MRTKALRRRWELCGQGEVGSKATGTKVLQEEKLGSPGKGS